jgi:hypothetical protein
MRVVLALLFAFAVHAQPVEYRVQLGSRIVNVYATRKSRATRAPKLSPKSAENRALPSVC